MPQTEVQLFAGGASQTTSSRWGDYSAMSVDPEDDCTFWYTNEYYDTLDNGNSANWQTRIGWFKFPACTPIPSLTPTVTPTETPTETPTICPTPTSTPTPTCEPDDLILNTARLAINTSSTTNRGSVRLAGVVNDNDTAGDLATSLLSTMVTLAVTASPGFNATIALTGCALTGSRGSVKCRSADSKTSAIFRQLPGPLLYSIRVKALGLGTPATGTLQPTAPVTVKIKQMDLCRIDTMNACTPVGKAKLRCREP